MPRSSDASNLLISFNYDLRQTTSAGNVHRRNVHAWEYWHQNAPLISSSTFHIMNRKSWELKETSDELLIRRHGKFIVTSCSWKRSVRTQAPGEFNYMLRLLTYRRLLTSLCLTTFNKVPINFTPKGNKQTEKSGKASQVLKASHESVLLCRLFKLFFEHPVKLESLLFPLFTCEEVEKNEEKDFTCNLCQR